MTKRNILLTPGPTPVPPEVLRAMAEPIFHHRTPRYRELFREVSEDLKAVFRTAQTVYTFTGSGTLAMEASVVNFLSPGDKVIVLEAGKFGERWTEIAKRYQLNAIPLKVPYGEVIQPDEVERVLKLHPDTKAVYGTHCETSTGVLFDVEAMAKFVGKTNAIFVVDAISSLAADRLEMDAWGVDVLVSGSQKGLMIPPGLAFLAISKKAWALHKGAKLPRYYVDLASYDKSLKDWDTPFTPALTLVLALKEALGRIKKEKMERVWKRTEELALQTREAMKRLGLELFAKRPANTLTAVLVPRGIDGEKLVSVMRDEKGLTLAGGQGEMKGKIFRIAHLGYITTSDIQMAVSVIKETLAELSRQSSPKVQV
ncbi:MAG: alanine--glyoxylate aminotransferase family protein [Candidatus Omnitrophica bacterium]|nr:alanine--glyoxylate aminotransferase family protein [Candidatus Omnitrophota bacterium]